MRKLNVYENVPDFETLPVRRPHSYEISDMAAMTKPMRETVTASATKPLRQSNKPTGERFTGPKPAVPSAPAPQSRNRALLGISMNRVNYRMK